MSDYIEVPDETAPGSILDGDTLIHTDMTSIMAFLSICLVIFIETMVQSEQNRP